MPAKSKAKQRFMAEHGATFPMAKQVRASMSVGQMHDFAAGPMKGKSSHVAAAKKQPHANLGKWLHPTKRGR